DPMELVVEFHRAFDAPIYEGKPGLEHMKGRVALRQDLIDEEVKELHDAVWDRDIVEVADALADLVYVIYGFALEAGIPLAQVLEEVHRSNMSKLGEDGKPILRGDGKILKGPDYHPPY